MKYSRIIARCAAGLIVGLTAVVHRASADDLGGFYVGANGGRDRFDYDLSSYQRELLSQSASAGTLGFGAASRQRENTVWWVDTGYMVSPYVGVEASYVHLGQVRNEVVGSFTATGGSPEPVRANVDLRSAGPTLGVLVRLPLTEGIDVNLRAADYYGRTTYGTSLNVGTSNSSSEPKASNSSLLVGLGAAYTFGGHWSAAANYLRIQHAGNSTTVAQYNVDLISLGVSYTF